MAKKVNISLTLFFILLLVIFIGFKYIASNTMADVYYPQNGSNKIWLNNGEFLAVPEKNVIRLVNLHNCIEKEIVLPPDKLPEEYQLYLFEQGIIVANADWHHIDFSLWDWNGKRLYNFKNLEDNKDNPIKVDYILEDGVGYNLEIRPYWVDENYIIINTGLQIFSLNLKDESIKKIYNYKVNDFDKNAVYWETNSGDCCVSDNAFYFLAHTIRNDAGCIIKFQNGECKVLFKGKQFTDFMITDKIIITMVLGERNTEYYYADKNDLLTEPNYIDISTDLRKCYYTEYIDNQRFALAIRDKFSNTTKVNCLEQDTKVLTIYEMTEFDKQDYQITPEFIMVKEIKDELYFIFREQNGTFNGLSNYVVYNQAGEYITTLNTEILQNEYEYYGYAKPEYYIEYYTEEDKTNRLNTIVYLKIKNLNSEIQSK